MGLKHTKRGTIIVFADNVSDEAVDKAMGKIKGVLDAMYHGRSKTVYVSTYDPSYGQPVWYIP